MRGELPTGTVTLLFSDVEGSTTLLHELGAEAYAGVLAEHRRIVRAACAAEGGVEVDNQGDAFFFAFRTAPAALAAAQTVTGALAVGRIQVRIGLHTGTPLVTEEGYVGDDVHLAARVGASGHGGQVVLSRTTRELVDGLPLTDLGEHRLKDIPGAVSIFQLGSERFPPLKTISNTNLPRPASSSLDFVLAPDSTGPGALTETLAGIALAADTRDVRSAAQVRGAVNKLDEAVIRSPRSLQLERDLEQPLIEALGADEYANEQALGAGMDTDDAIDLARALANPASQGASAES